MLTTLICCSVVLYYYIMYAYIITCTLQECSPCDGSECHLSTGRDDNDVIIIGVCVCVYVCNRCNDELYIYIYVWLYYYIRGLSVCVYKKSHDRLSAHVQRLIFKFRFRHNETTLIINDPEACSGDTGMVFRPDHYYTYFYNIIYGDEDVSHDAAASAR